MDNEIIIEGLPGRLKAIRKVLKLNQTDMATRAGISRGFYSRVETGIQTPSYDFIVKICVTYGVSFDWLILNIGQMFIKDNKALSAIDSRWIPILSKIEEMGDRVQIPIMEMMISVLKAIQAEHTRHK